MPDTSTRYGDLRPATARLVAAATLAVIAVLVVLAATAGPRSTPEDSEGDIDTYSAIASDMRAGEGYYDAARHQLLEGGYGLQSVFNWRTPLHPQLVALAPSDRIAQGGLAAVALLAAAAAVALFGRTGQRSVLLAGGTAAALSLITAIIPGTIFFAEVTAGILILFSVAMFALDRRAAGVVLGLLALFVRELSGLYVVVAMVLAARERRWREVGGWAIGLVTYAGYFLWHRQQVLEHVRPNDPGYPSGWVQFGGPDFVLRTAQMDGILFALPLVVTAVALPLAVLGLVGWKGSGSLLAIATVAAYLLLFAVVGKPFNFYWGAMYTPVLIIGFAFLPNALRDLAARAMDRGGHSPNGLDHRPSH